jgi:pimeloyl-ACP methyl ester carboxylesterase
VSLQTRAGIVFEISDEGRPPGWPLLLIHGAGAEHRFWPEELRHLTSSQVLAPDLPGHGDSPGPAAGSIIESATRLRQWLREIGLGPTILVGHSMGSAIALEFALHWPEEVAGLVLVGSGVRLPVNPWLLQATAETDLLPQAIAKITQWSFARQAPQALSDWVTERTMAAAPGVLHRDLAACDAFDAEARLPQLCLPALVLCGQEDRMTPPPASLALAEAIPNAELEFIADAGHYVMLEQPTAVERRLRLWLARWFPASEPEGTSG